MDAERLLDIWDECAEQYTFPMLDNAHAEFAAARLALYRGDQPPHADDLVWALTVEVLDYSDRMAGVDLNCFGHPLRNRATADDFVTPAAYSTFMAENPCNEFSVVCPITDGTSPGWLSGDTLTHVVPTATDLRIRGDLVPLPRDPAAYAAAGIVIDSPDRIRPAELLRLLATTHREALFAKEAERRHHVPEAARRLLELDEWQHPDLAAGECPSESETFRQLAEVLATGNVAASCPTQPPNTHWQQWADA